MDISQDLAPRCLWISTPSRFISLMQAGEGGNDVSGVWSVADCEEKKKMDQSSFCRWAIRNHVGEWKSSDECGDFERSSVECQ